ncbi:MAG: pyridoxal-phosphate dependent enzyme [Fretibacterium sp.]|nr:pyridoxal-phosphate dependent enzyme [Fretibacterium sp.]
MLHCIQCGARFGERELIWRCPCGGTLQLSGYNPRPASSQCSPWRYLNGFFPALERDALVTMGEGNTPLIERSIAGHKAWFKLDYLMPSGSYKDRGMSVLATWLRTVGLTKVVEDSSGNAGASLAAYCAAGGIACDVYVPSYTSAGKCVQIAAYGGNLVRIPGSREKTTQAAMEAGRQSFYASHNWSPWFLHGVKTWFLEVHEHLPDVKNIVVPVGQGSIALGAWLAMEDLRHMGVDVSVRILGVQPEACAPLARAFEEKKHLPATIEKRETAAEGIASSEPVRGAEVLETVRSSKGTFVTVNEEELWEALNELGKAGLFLEPTSAAAVAGWKKLLKAGELLEEEETVVFLSGSGLKASDKIAAHFEPKLHTSNFA